MRWVSVSPKYYVMAGIFMSAAAQIFLKLASSQKMWCAPWLGFIASSLFSYGLAFLGYYLALKHFEISKISPMMMASIVSIIALYGFAAGEHMSYLKILGIMLAIISIFLISSS